MDLCEGSYNEPCICGPLDLRRSNSQFDAWQLSQLGVL
jgi:hypothetical protein